MLEPAAALLVVRFCEGYVGLGLAAALLAVFVPALGSRVDRGIASSPLGFRLLILPGCILLWPWLALRMTRGDGEPPIEGNAHRARSTP
ncbi:MAG: hypothetical protein U0900_05315 [Myxococcota bacterium]